ncbi:MAG: hypothetical protein RLZZ536_2440, partial [Planctomycetota bacterium]
MNRGGTAKKPRQGADRKRFLGKWEGWALSNHSVPGHHSDHANGGSTPRRTERTGGSPRLRFGTLVPTPPRGVSGNVSGRAEAPGCEFGTLVPTPARGVSS